MIMAINSITFFFSLLLLALPTHSFVGVYLDLNTAKQPVSPYELIKFLNNTYIRNIRISGLEPDFIVPLKSRLRMHITVTATYDNIIGFSSVSGCKVFADKAFDQYKLKNHFQTLVIGNNPYEYFDNIFSERIVTYINNMHTVLTQKNLNNKIKLTTVISTKTLTRSDIPSMAEFRQNEMHVIKPLLQHLRKHRSPFMMSTYPYYDYATKATPQIKKLCLFQPNRGRVDPGTGLNYTNMFAIKVDSMRTAMNKLGYNDVDLMVAETGWPTNEGPGEIGGSVRNARLYNLNLIRFLRKKVGTPLMPNKTIDTFIATLLDTNDLPNLDHLPVTNKTMGIVHDDWTWKYRINLRKNFR